MPRRTPPTETHLTPESSPHTSGGVILGLDNVRLDLPIAGVGTRTPAAFLDYLMLFALLGLWWTGGLVSAGLLGLGQGWMLALLTIGSFLIQWSYFAVFEVILDGQTPGKNLFGVRVVSAHGGRSSLGAIVVRNLIRPVDLVFGLACMAIDHRSRRLGDLAAGTLVIHQRTPGENEEVRLGRLPEGWSGREIVVVESFLCRAPRMEPEIAQGLAERLLRWIAARQEAFVEQAGEREVIEQMNSEMDRVALLRRLLQVTPTLDGPGVG